MSIEQSAQELIVVATKDIDMIIAYLVERPFKEVAHLLKLSQPEPAPEPAPDGYVRVPYPAPNYGVNVLVLDDEDATPIEQYAVNPEPYAQRVWAGFN